MSSAAGLTLDEGGRGNLDNPTQSAARTQQHRHIDCRPSDRVGLRPVRPVRPLCCGARHARGDRAGQSARRSAAGAHRVRPPAVPELPSSTDTRCRLTPSQAAISRMDMPCEAN
jgi:hypothetical protein